MTSTTYSPLLTDFYQLTMAYGYWRLNMHEQEAVFHLIYRKNPFNSNYALAAGLASAVEFLANWRFQPDDLDYIATLKNPRGEQLFPQEFLTYLEQLRFSCDIDAIPEGTVVSPQLPLLRVQGPLLQCQFIEAAISNFINFQTLVATKAARVCHIAKGDPVMEFGLRRSQGPDGAISASRAAYIGGCVATSNTLAGKRFAIPVCGTHAHSWISAFNNELEAMQAYANIMPHQCILLVDTYHTLKGVQHAIEVGKKLRAEGADLMGIRLDSGDLADLSIKARKMLDEAGFTQTIILASNSLDEYVIKSLQEQQAKITTWAVGTHLTTAYDQPALDGVYKLSALRDKDNRWQYKIKLSEQSVKISNPGRLQVRRFFAGEHSVKDVIYDMDLGITEKHDSYVDLLQPIMRKGKLAQELESIHTIRERALVEVKRFYAAHADKVYPVELEKNLAELKQKLIAELR